MSTATLKFSAIYRNIERSPPSGSSPTNWMQHAKEIYSQQTKGQLFKVKGAWEVLRSHPKWIGDFQSNPHSTSSSYGCPSSPMLSKPSLQRPLGVKSSKRKQSPSEPYPDADELLSRIDSIAGSNTIALHQNEIADRQNSLAEMFYELKAKKTEAKVAMGQLQVILQSEANCPDDDSKEMLRMLKKKVCLQMASLKVCLQLE